MTRFKGRPGELSPKARFWLFAGWLFPSRFKYVSLHSPSLISLTHHIISSYPPYPPYPLHRTAKIAPNPPSTDTTGLSADKEARKFATLSTTTLRLLSPTGLPSSRWTFARPWTTSAASSSGYRQPPRMSGQRSARKTRGITLRILTDDLLDLVFSPRCV